MIEALLITTTTAIVVGFDGKRWSTAMGSSKAVAIEVQFILG
jgi:hypothetical protein